MCIFCMISQHQIPADILYEDETIIAILDINPVTQGHALVISKKHYEDLVSTPSYVFARMHAIAKFITQRYDQVLKPKGYNYLSNTNEIAGQSVFHVHLHVIPRYDAHDGLVLQFNTAPLHHLSPEVKDQLKLK